MDNCYCTITPDLIAADIFCAEQLLEKYEEQKNPLFFNLSSYHSAQAAEKSLKYFIFKTDPNEFMEVGNTHNFKDLIFHASMVRDNFTAEHHYLTENYKALSSLNNVRYSQIPLSEGETRRYLSIAKQIFEEVCNEYGKPKFMQLDKQHKAYKPSICENEKYITTALEKLDEGLNEQGRAVKTPNGTVPAKDGYRIADLKQFSSHVQINCYMLSRSKAEKTKPNDGDKCSFFISKGKLYDQKEWNKHLKETQKSK